MDFHTWYILYIVDRGLIVLFFAVIFPLPTPRKCFCRRPW